MSVKELFGSDSEESTEEPPPPPRDKKDDDDSDLPGLESGNDSDSDDDDMPMRTRRGVHVPAARSPTRSADARLRASALGRELLDGEDAVAAVVDREGAVVADVPAIAPAVQEGYIPPDGVEYDEPTHRRAPAHTAWSKPDNGYARIDSNNTRKPRGVFPSGYVWSTALNGWRRTYAQTLEDERIRRETPQRPATSGGTDGFFGVDCVNGAMTEISWYVGGMGQHAPIRWFTNLITAFTLICNHEGSATVMSMERGDRRKLLHIQGVSRFITSETYKEQFKNFIRRHLGILTGGNIRCKIGIRYFSGQSWEYMLGYVQKDEGQPHYRLWSVGVTPAEMRKGRDNYSLVRRPVLLCVRRLCVPLCVTLRGCAGA